MKNIILLTIGLCLFILSSCTHPQDVGAGSTEYSCLSKSISFYCESVSGTRCYYTSPTGTRTYKTCPEAWVVMPATVTPEPPKVIVEGTSSYVCYNDNTCRKDGLLTNPLVPKQQVG